MPTFTLIRDHVRGLARMRAHCDSPALLRHVYCLTCAVFHRIPLQGKIVDYIQEDVDTMQKEMAAWKAEHEQHSAAFADEAAITDNELEPIRIKLADLDQQIKDQQDLIVAAKAQIAQNDLKTQRMLESVALAAR